MSRPCPNTFYTFDSSPPALENAICAIVERCTGEERTCYIATVVSSIDVCCPDSAPECQKKRIVRDSKYVTQNFLLVDTRGQMALYIGINSTSHLHNTIRQLFK